MYIDSVIKEMKIGMGKVAVRFSEKGRGWRLNANGLDFCGEMEVDLNVMVDCFVEVCKRRDPKVMEIVLRWKDGSVCEVLIDRKRLGHVSEFKCLGCV